MIRAPVRALVCRDLLALSRSRGVLVPMAIVPLTLLVLLPGLAAVAPSTGAIPEALLLELERLRAGMPDGLQAELAALSRNEGWITLILMHFMAPFYLVVPLMVASVIAADSFAGERERGTLEALAYTPTSDRELILGKLLTAWLPAVGVGLASFVLYGVTINAAGWSVMERVFFPNGAWLVLALFVGPAVAALGLLVGVLISARTRTVQEASQLGSIVVVPLVMLVVAQLSGRLYLTLPRALAMGAALWAVDAALFIAADRLCRRDLLVGRR
jgi:ABC-type transport system involved in multi-copper enzyme maturation permease subunit